MAGRSWRESILKSYVSHISRRASNVDSTKPVNIIVITDGCPTDDPESVIVHHAKKLDQIEAPPHQVGIQFFQVSNNLGNTKGLCELDDDLADNGIPDMVDTATWNSTTSENGKSLTADGILKVVLGAAVRRLDRRSTQGPSLQAFFPIGSVPTRFMIAFFRDRDPAGRCEPEGMESTSPSTNDVDVLSSSTLAVDSLATPAPSLQEETPHEEVEHQYLWRCFPDYVWSQRVRDTPSWVWGFGYDVEDSSGGRRWVCRRCIQNKNPKPRSFAEKGIQNANAHLFKGHGIRAPPDKTKSAAEKKAEKLKAKDQRSIAEVMKLDTRLPREQDIANSLVKGFDRKHFQRLLLEWIIEENHAFSVCEQGRLRQIFEYLNPLVKITDANITRTTIRRKVLSAYEMHKDKVVAALKQSCGLIHVSFDGWKSGNRHSLYGIACFFRDENSQPRKLALGVPELRTRHFGHNIAAEILDVLDAYGIQDKIGYFTLDNAESNDKAMEVIGGELGFVGSRRRGRCFGHTLNLSAKALLFGHNVEAFEEQLSGEAALSEAEHTLWRRKGPVGKLHNLVVDVRRSDQLTYLLRSIQRSEFDLSSDPRIRARQPVDLIIDNDTRWLSQLYMIRRAIILRPFIEQLVLKHRQQWEQDNRSKRTGNLRKSAREPRICLEENQLTVNDWVVLEHLAKLLGFYEDAVKTLEGDGQQRKRKGGWVGSYGNVWEVIQGFEFLLEVLEDYKQLASEIPDAEHFRINVNLGWEKLNKYYSRLDETPIYYTALALHPAFRWGYFENEWKDNTKWVMKAKQMIREVWESNYRHLQMVRSPVDDEPVAKRQRKYYNPFQAYCERTRPVLGYGLVKEEATLSDDINEDTNELELWQSSWEDGDNDVRDPISYWHERKRRYPRLSRMALDFLTIQPMSAECERMFAAAGRMVTPLRNRLDADIIGMCQVLRSWLRAGVIDDLDVSLLPTENGRGDRAEEGS
ncbi:putative AC transposase [Fusarium oxysporum f. sp. conglutinans]|nr:putative AC transposase [Fusarium oxysporum f. sp. conglutinans]